MTGLFGSGLRINPTPPRRRVFFSFHFEDDIMRANVIRNSGQFLEMKGHFDASLWEETKAQGDAALKRLINSGLENTTVTCILTGALTWNRRWVRYEIAKSVARGNGLFSVDISNVECARTGFCQRGPNPLDNMGVAYDGSRQLKLVEWSNGQWIWYADYTESVSIPRYLVSNFDGVMQLSRGARSYNWTNHQDLSAWSEAAASQVGA